MATYFSTAVCVVDSVETIEPARRELMAAEGERPSESFSARVMSVKQGLLAAKFLSGKSRVEPQLGVLFGGNTGGSLGAASACCYVVQDWENGCAARCFVDGVLRAKTQSDQDNSAWEEFAAACRERDIDAASIFRD